LAVIGDLERRLGLITTIDAELARERRARPIKVRRRGVTTAAAMSVPETTETCRDPGCDRPALPVAETGGRPPGYCEDPEHTAARNRS
jgi:hypothetical protein